MAGRKSARGFIPSYWMGEVFSYSELITMIHPARLQEQDRKRMCRCMQMRPGHTHTSSQVQKASSQACSFCQPLARDSRSGDGWHWVLESDCKSTLFNPIQHYSSSTVYRADAHRTGRMSTCLVSTVVAKSSYISSCLYQQDPARSDPRTSQPV